MQGTKIVELRLINTYMLNDRMRHLEFQLVSNLEFNHKPGQFICLHFPQHEKIIYRNFSVANAPNSNNINKIEIAATFVPNGIASTALWNMQIGDRINASGPFGTFILYPQDFLTTKRYILMATGTGVTPYRAMLNSFKENLQKYPIEIILLLGVRDSSELLYKEDFISLATEQPRFTFVACYSREQPSLNNHNTINKYNVPTIYPVHEHYGYVQDKLAELNINPDVDLAYLCGNPNMVDNALATLETLGMPRNKIRREKYISSK